MDSDMVVALASATADGRTLLAHRQGGADLTLVCERGRCFAAGECVRLGDLDLPQARHTHTVVGSRPGGGWGYAHGVNAAGLSVARLPFRSRLALDAAPLTGPDLVRLALERCGGARQAVDLVGDLVTRHGQSTPEGESQGAGRDSAFLIADGTEAFLLATCGRHWGLQEVRQVRAVGGVCHLRQDWDRVSRGLADVVIGRGWWPEDGSKIDFEGTVGYPNDLLGLRHWGRLILLLEEWNGQISVAMLRRLLSDRPGPERLAGPEAWLVAQAPRHPDDVTVAWCGLGTAEVHLSFPLYLCGDVPAAFTEGGSHGVRERLHRLAELAQAGPDSAAAVAEQLAALQSRFDQEAREFHDELPALRRDGDRLPRQATLFMQHQLERFEDLARQLLPAERPEPVLVGVEG